MSLLASTPPALPEAPVAKARQRRLLLPREHGAYFQLAVPLATALAMGRPTIASWSFAVAAMAAFVGHESLLVVIGARGARAARQDRSRATRVLAGLAFVTVGGGALGWSTSPSSLGASLLIPVVLTAALAVLIVLHRERTSIGELIAGAALTSASLAVAYASNVPASYVWPAWLTWLLVTGAGTWAVRTIIAKNKSSERGRARSEEASRLGACGPGVGTTRDDARFAAVIVLILATATLAIDAPWAAIAAAPAVVLSVLWMTRPPHPRNLRRVGWSLAAANLAAAVVLVASTRLASGPFSAS